MSFLKPRLGHGIGLRPRHFDRLLADRPPVDWMEAVSENYLAPGGTGRWERGCWKSGNAKMGSAPMKVDLDGLFLKLG